MKSEKFSTPLGKEYWGDPVAKQLHRVGGPAVISHCYSQWCQYGRLHRLDGPADEHASGVVDYWIHGEWYSKDEFDRHPLVIEHRLNLALKELANEE